MAKENEAGRLTIKNAKLLFRNFAGQEGPYNRKGDRNFAVILDPDLAEQLVADGWNVKELAAREEGDTPTPYLQVAVNFDNRPPRITMISSTGRTTLTADTVSTLDYAEIAKADVLINPYHWTVQDKSGIKAYLKTLFVTIEEDELELLYAEVQDADDAEELLDD